MIPSEIPTWLGLVIAVLSFAFGARWGVQYAGRNLRIKHYGSDDPSQTKRDD